jgi:hypothetical protein
MENEIIYNADNTKSNSWLLPSSNTAVIKPQSRHKLPPKLFFTDWLSISCKRITPPSSAYTVKKRDYGTSVYEIVAEYYMNKIPILTVYEKPRSSILPADSVLLKFDNQQLYDINFFDNIHYLIAQAGLIYKSINRIDLCVDFQTFDGNYEPLVFIKDFLKEKILHNGRHKIKAIGNSGNTNVWDYLRIGTNNSLISVYLYNKSKELREVKQKNYIQNIYNRYYENQTKDIWRLEISVKTGINSIIDIETGEIVEYSLNYLLTEINRFKMFSNVINRHFTFVDASTNARKTRARKIKLFEDMNEFTSKLAHLTYKVDTTRINKITLRKLITHYDMIKDNSFSLSQEYSNIIVNYAKEYFLEDWLKEKTNFDYKFEKVKNWQTL